MNIKPVKKVTVQKPYQAKAKIVQVQNKQLADDPGKTLGIVGFIFAFIGLSIVGVILSAIGYHKSKVAGFKNGLALAGIWVNAIFLILVIPILIVITTIAYTGITARANTSRAESNASSVQSTADVYHAVYEHYPDEVSDFTIKDSIIALPASVTLVHAPEELNRLNGNTSVTYQYTGEFSNATGGRIAYWDFTTSNISNNVIYVGDATQYSQFKDIK